MLWDSLIVHINGIKSKRCWINLIIMQFFFRNEEAKAARLAREIESNPSSQNRANLENGDEEER